MTWEQRLKYLTYVLYLTLFYCFLYLYMFNYARRYKHLTGKLFEEKSVTISNVIPLHTSKVPATTEKQSYTDMKNILIWNPNSIPFHLIKYKQDVFAKYNCKHTNCLLTYDKNYLENQTDFDAILFSGCLLKYMNQTQLPKKRSLKQRYVFTTIEPSTLYPVTNPLYDNFFNWTWTHRLHSDVLWRYITIYDLNGTTIGPGFNIKWPKDMKPIDGYTKSKLKSKTKAAAWFVSHCRTIGHREDYVKYLNVELEKYGWTVDKYGWCGNVTCNKSESCFKMVQKDYYFYLSFENSLEEDYVSEKLLTALNNFAVPVMYGGADYARFLPPGSYLDARTLGPTLLAKAMDDAIRNKTQYYDYFRWRNNFRYEASDASSEICNICTALNNQDMMGKTSVYNDFRLWWNGALKQKTYEIMLKNFLINNALLNFASTFNFTRANSLRLLQFVKNQSSYSQ